MRRILVILLMLAGCSTLQRQAGTDGGSHSGTIAETSMIYLVREESRSDAQPLIVVLDGATEGLTYPGTFIRWQVSPGPHRISGYGADTGAIDISAEPGKTYFVYQSVSRVQGLLRSEFRRMDERDGRGLIARSRSLALY